MTATFTLKLQAARESQTFDDIEVFVGEDTSGSFSVLAHHAQMMTSLIIGMARFRRHGESWQYIAVPEAILYFRDNTLQLSTRRYLLDTDYQRISELLQQQLLAEESQLKRVKSSLLQMEEQVFKRLWELGHGQVADISGEGRTP